MAKRQRRIPFTGKTPPEAMELTNSSCTLVKTDNSVIFVKIISVDAASLVILNPMGRRETIPSDAVRELILDSYA